MLLLNYNTVELSIARILSYLLYEAWHLQGFECNIARCAKALDDQLAERRRRPDRALLALLRDGTQLYS